MSHTSGLEREPKLGDAAFGSIYEWENKVLQAIPKTSFLFKPDEKHSYSNIGYGILGLALSRAAKKPFIELVKNKIFKPLNMNNSYFIIPDNKSEKLAKGMEGGPFGSLNMDTPAKEHNGRGYKVPNGAIYSTPNDLAKFMISNMGYTELLNNKNLILMQKAVTTKDKDWWQNYGLGLRLLRDNLVSTAGHTGSVSGYTANFMFDTENNYGVVIMLNYNWGMTNVDLRSFAVLRRLKKLELR